MDFDPLLLPATRFTAWRLRSRWCAVADAVALAAGASLCVIAGVDSVASWPSNRVLLSDQDLSRIAGVLLFPTWPWVLASVAMVYGISNTRRDRRAPRAHRPGLPRLSAWSRACWVSALAACGAIVIGGFIVGAAKGGARVLPGPRYQVSTLDLNQANWTTVPPGQFQLWQARYIREDGLFMFFGLAVVAFCVLMFHLRRRAAHASR
jgi:hypothetical protein